MFVCCCSTDNCAKYANAKPSEKHSFMSFFAAVLLHMTGSPTGIPLTVRCAAEHARTMWKTCLLTGFLVLLCAVVDVTAAESADTSNADDNATSTTTTESDDTTAETTIDWRQYLRNDVRAPGKKRGRRYRAKEKTEVEVVIEAGEDAEEEIIDVDDRRLDLQDKSADASAWKPHGPVREKTHERRQDIDGQSRLVRE